MEVQELARVQVEDPWAFLGKRGLSSQLFEKGDMRASVLDPARFIGGASRVSSATVGVSDVPLSVWGAKLSQTCKYEFGAMNC